MSGILYLVSTPIGNMDDLSPRAANLLGNSKVIVCEDTRTLARILNFIKSAFKLGISDHQTIVLTDYTERKTTEKIIGLLVNGSDVAVVTDAGTPLISDPGYNLIARAVLFNIKVINIPGPTAAISTAVLSGFPCDRILVWGFLPKKASDKIKVFQKIKDISDIEPTTCIFYESPHRVLETLEIFKVNFPTVRVSLSREISKIHEETLRGTGAEITEKLAKPVLGEIALAIRFK